MGKTTRMILDIECAGELTRGQMIADRRRTGRTVPNADVALALDEPLFADLFLSTMLARP